MRILIATTKRPIDKDHATSVFRMIRTELAELSPDCTIPVFFWTTGKGCYNLAFEFIGPDSEAEKLANVLTLVLMPARWTTTQDALPKVDTIDIFDSQNSPEWLKDRWQK